MSADKPLLDPAIFEHLKHKLEEETEVRDTLTQIVQRLERAVAATQGLLSRVHSTTRAHCEFSTSLPAALRIAYADVCLALSPCSCGSARGQHQGGSDHCGRAQR